MICRSLPAPQPDEASVYSAVPAAAWFLLAIAVSGFVGQVVIGLNRNPIQAWSGLAGLLAACLVLYAMPHLRGYEFFGRDDNATYLGTLHSLIDTGHLAPDNFYPGSTLVAYQIVAFAGLPLGWLAAVGRLLPLLVYVLGSVILARCVLRTRRWDAFVAVAALLPLAGGYLPGFSPAGFGVSLTPLAIATFLPEIGQTAMGRRARTVLLLSFAFVHPLGCLVLLGSALVVLGVLRLMSRLRPGMSKNAASSVLTAATLLGVSFAAWMAPSMLFARQLISVRDAILSGVGQSPGLFALGLAQRAHLSLGELVALPFLTNLGVVLGASIGFIACCVALSRRRVDWVARQRGVGVLLGIELLLALAFLASLVAPLNLDYYRFLHFFAIIIPVLLGVAAALVGHARRLASGAVMVAMGIASVPFIYASPLIRVPTEFVPASEIEGTRWLLASNDGSHALPVTWIQTFNRDVDLAIGFESRRQRSEIANPIPIPDHFGNQGDGLIHLGNRETVVLTVSVADVATYTGMWASANRLTAQDFHLLTIDPRLSRVYATDAINFYVVLTDQRAVAGSASP